MSPENKIPYKPENDPGQENKDGDAVDPVHIFHPLGMWRIRIPLLDVEILSHLPPNSHNNRITI
jgi:hypothetical protein